MPVWATHLIAGLTKARFPAAALTAAVLALGAQSLRLDAARAQLIDARACRVALGSAR